VIKLAMSDETLADMQNRKDILLNNEETKKQRQPKFAHAFLVLPCLLCNFLLLREIAELPASPLTGKAVTPKHSAR
jgi:hypothetical protein